ncbi:hypothetical protein IJH74_00555 [Candidatus Saccharibacteria bacterium]|nr:hypothetical protein [Candidatus Saccharibacteria bacterium]
MTSGGKKFSLARWLDECSLALRGFLMLTKEPRFWLFFIPFFIIFGTLLNLLSGGMAALNLFGAVDFSGKIKILGDAFLNIFGVNQNFLDWLLVFAITLLQSALIGGIAVVWKYNKDQASLQNSGIAAGLAILGSGCPTCGTALLTPIIGAIFSSGSYMIAGVVSGIITVLAILIVLFSLKKVGLDAYMLITSKHRQKKTAKQQERKKNEKSN